MKTTNAAVEEALNWRYAAKKFDPARKIPATDWETLTRSLVYAPSSYGIQPWKFLVVENPAVRSRLREVSWNQSQVTDASHLVVLVAKESVTHADVERYLNRIREVRDVPADSLAAFRQMLNTNLVEGMPAEKALGWSQRQTYIAMGFLLETAALLKIDSTPMEGLDPAAYDRILELTGSGWRTVAAVALGYRHADDGFQAAKKVRYPENELITYVK